MEHRALLEALASGDAARAEGVLQEELASAKAMVLEALMSSNTLLDASISLEKGAERWSGS